MENQHRHIAGYRELSQAEIDVMNEVKSLSELVGAIVVQLRRAGAGIDQRWVSIGATELQQGFMALIRAIAQPTTF